MRVGIVGGGIAGLTAAVAFGRIGAEVTVFERPGTAPAGAGISLFGNGLRALDAVGLGVAVRALGSLPPLPAGIRRPDGRWLARTQPAATTDLCVVHRADLQRILAAAAPEPEPAVVVAVSTTGTTARVDLASGGQRAFDLVVGADGIGSRARRAVVADPGIDYAGYTAWRGVTAARLAVDAAGETWGHGQRFGIAPLGDGRVYWFATASVPPGGRADDEKKELVGRFEGWHEPIRALLDATEDDAVLRNDILELAAPLPRYVNGRVALVGDAAHAMTPNLGQGGNQALEDAVTLAATVSRHLDPTDAMAEYDVVRRARVEPIVRRSRQIGRMGQVSGSVGVALRNALIRLTPAGSTARAAQRIQRWDPPQLSARLGRPATRP
jgi:2-polyprenyl-6-methoxyphenol hydroxylase-like FAD-dependent oxidoreductase